MLIIFLLLNLSKILTICSVFFLIIFRSNPGLYKDEPNPNPVIFTDNHLSKFFVSIPPTANDIKFLGKIADNALKPLVPKRNAGKNF